MNPSTQEFILNEAARIYASGESVALKVVPWSNQFNVPIREVLLLVQAMLTAAEPAAEQKWETPSSEEIPLHTLDPEKLGLDFIASEDDAKLTDAIIEAKRQKSLADWDPLPDAPRLFKQIRNWVRWKLENVGGRDTKVPYQVNGNKASASDRSTWTDYQTAATGWDINDSQGVGFVLIPELGIVGFDLDDCRNPRTGDIKPWAFNFIDRFLRSYMEITPSGTGIRVFVLGKKPDGKHKIYLAASAGAGQSAKSPQIEVYDRLRYFTVTGDRISDSSEITGDAAVAYQIALQTAREYPPIEKIKENSSSAFDDSSTVEIKSGGKAITSKLALLMHGEIISRVPFVVKDAFDNSVEYPSQSEADMALATVLAVKHGGHVTNIDEDFRESALYRQKWERQDYRDNTIKKAVASAESRKTEAQTRPAPQGNQDIPIIDDDDNRFEMIGDVFDTKVYEEAAKHFTPYPEPGEDDLISLLAQKLVHGTSIPLAYVREPLKAIILHALDKKLVHPAYPRLSLRGNYFSLGESEGGKTTGLEFALEKAAVVLKNAEIHVDSLFRYKSETTFIRSLSAEGTQKRDSEGKVKSGSPGHSSQFLHIKEGNLVANSTDYFSAVFSMLTNLYDQTEAGTESMTNGNFTADNVRISCVMCFTPSDFRAVFGGKGNIGGGGLNRWGLVNPNPIKTYDDKDWERLPDSVFNGIINSLATKVFELASRGNPMTLIEEPGATKVRLETKAMLKKAGKVGNRLLDYFMREQVAQAALAVDGSLVMTEKQATYAKRWVEAQLDCRRHSWPSDAENKIEVMEVAIRKAVNRHLVSESRLKDATHFYRENSGGWYAFGAARKNALSSGAIRLTGRTRRGVRAYCPGTCKRHPSIKDEDEPKLTVN